MDNIETCPQCGNEFIVKMNGGTPIPKERVLCRECFGTDSYERGKGGSSLSDLIHGNVLAREGEPITSDAETVEQ